MSIESEITRIENAKLSIKNAIQEKGVEVEDTTIDNYPDKIRQIQTDVFSQSDWNQSDSSSREFIKNKPNISATSAGDITIEAPYCIDLKAPSTSVKELNINDTGILRAESENLVYEDRLGDTHYLIHDDSLKTINGNSLLGSGDIVISGGDGNSLANVQAVEISDQVEDIIEISGVQYKKTIYVENDSEPNIDLLNENTIYIINQPVVGITIASFNTTHPISEYIIQFSTQDSAYLTLPSNVIWANGQSPKIEANSFYELSINTVLINNNYVYKAILVPFK